MIEKQIELPINLSLSRILLRAKITYTFSYYPFNSNKNTFTKLGFKKI